MVLAFLVSLCLAWSDCSAEAWKRLLDHADSLFQAQQYESAIVTGEKALGEATSRFGQADSVTALVLHRLGVYNSQAGQTQLAESLFTQALEIRERVLGPNHLDVAATLYSLAGAVLNQYRYAEARPFAERALAIREAILGSNHMDVVSALNLVALICFNLADYCRAEDLVERALAICRELYGEAMYDEPSLGNLLFFSGAVYQEHGKYAEAEYLHMLALANREKNLGSKHPLVGVTLSALGRTYREQAKYAEAEEVGRRALALAEETLGPDHLNVAMFSHDLAVLYWYQGKYDDAEVFYKRALAIAEEQLPPGHIHVAATLNNLADIYEIKGEYAKAEDYIKRALPMWREFYGFDHPSFARNLINLGLLYENQGRYAEAESLLTQALAIMENTLGSEHHLVGWHLGNLADLYVDMDRYDESESLLSRALMIVERALGPDHPDVAGQLESYSMLCRLRGDYGRAFELSARAFDIRLKSFGDNSYVLSERDALTYSNGVRASSSKCLSCYFDSGEHGREITRRVADLVLLSKGHVSDEIFERRVALVDETDSATLDLAEVLRNVKFELSQLFIGGPGDGGTDEYRHQMDSLSTLAAATESALARRSASFRVKQRTKDISVDRIRELLPAGTALVEYLKYDYYGLHPRETIPHYLVLVITKDGEPHIVDLGEAQNVDELGARYREHMLMVASAGHFPTHADKHEYAAIAKKLYDAVVDPIEPMVFGVETVFIAPDAGLNLISFGGLVDDDSAYLVEKLAIHHLSAGRDLARFEYVDEPGTGLLALGDPDYDLSQAIHLAMTGPSGQPPSGHHAIQTRSGRSGCTDLRIIRLGRLPHARREVESIADLWARKTDQPVTVYLGKEASEENLKGTAPGSQVIHLATHGYFVEGKCGLTGEDGSAATDDFVGENPLLLSGLFLAGANLAGRTADSLGCEDGILTAYEVSAMNLGGVSMVVLSACESGLGEVREGEGVYGLRRAFQIAGVRTVVSALWPVSDEITADLMARLYDRTGETLPEAIRSAQLATIDNLRVDGQTDHPYGWAAFIALGDWR